MTIQLWSMIIPILVIDVLFQFLPRWTRREVFFTITVRPGFRDTSEAHEISRRYRMEVGYTLNLGNPRAWLVLLAMLGPVGLSIFLLG